MSRLTRGKNKCWSPAFPPREKSKGGQKRGSHEHVCAHRQRQNSHTEIGSTRAQTDRPDIRDHRQRVRVLWELWCGLPEAIQKVAHETQHNTTYNTAITIVWALNPPSGPALTHRTARLDCIQNYNDEIQVARR